MSISVLTEDSPVRNALLSGCHRQVQIQVPGKVGVKSLFSLTLAKVKRPTLPTTD
jgi:hypothetical protein